MSRSIHPKAFTIHPKAVTSSDSDVAAVGHQGHGGVKVHHVGRDLPIESKHWLQGYLAHKKLPPPRTLQ